MHPEHELEKRHAGMRVYTSVRVWGRAGVCGCQRQVVQNDFTIIISHFHRRQWFLPDFLMKLHNSSEWKQTSGLTLANDKTHRLKLTFHLSALNTWVVLRDFKYPAIDSTPSHMESLHNLLFASVSTCWPQRGELFQCLSPENVS